MVPTPGFEPGRGRPQRFLRPPRLPFRHIGLGIYYSGTAGILRPPGPLAWKTGLIGQEHVCNIDTHADRELAHGKGPTGNVR